MEKEIRRIEEGFEKAERKTERELGTRKAQKNPEGRLKIEERLQKEREKLEGELQKALEESQLKTGKESRKMKKMENKKTDKLLWVVLINSEEGRNLPVLIDSAEKAR